MFEQYNAVTWHLTCYSLQIPFIQFWLLNRIFAKIEKSIIDKDVFIKVTVKMLQVLCIIQPNNETIPLIQTMDMFE